MNLLEQALDALKDFDYDKRMAAIEALGKALEQEPVSKSLTDELMDCVDRLGSEWDSVDPRVWEHLLIYAPKIEQEPVAWVTQYGIYITPSGTNMPIGTKLYTHPQPKEWVGLTDEEIDECDWGQSERDYARAVEAKLKQKNGIKE